MKKKLLLTTALVAFSMPALAEINDLGVVGDWKPTKDEISLITKVSGKTDLYKGDIVNYPTLIFIKNLEVSIKDGEYVGNAADSGGVFAISGTGGVLDIENSVFENNRAYFDGGAISNFGGLTIKNTLFKGNTAAKGELAKTDPESIGGGAIALGSVSSTQIASITNTTFEGNKSGTNGGAIGTRLGKNGDNSTAKLSIEAEFTGNEAELNGGAIYNTFYAGEKGVTVKGNFTSNTAGNNGGAIYNDGAKDLKGNDGGVMTVSDSIFTKNSSESFGGAIFDKGELTVSDSTFSNNSSYSNGAITNFGRLTTVTNSTFTSNTAEADGGAIGIYKTAVVSDSVFTSNAAGTDDEANGGGAIFVGQTGNATLTNVEFYGNTSGRHGGAIAARHFANQGYLSIDTAIFDGNDATEEGGAIASIYNGIIDIKDSTFTNNTAGTNGGAIYVGKAINYGGGAGTQSTNGGVLNLSGTNVFSGNTANGKLNDIHNTGTINVSGELTLDGGISGDGNIVFNGATLGATYNTTKIENKADLSGLDKIKLAISEVVDSLELDNLFTHEDNVKGEGYAGEISIENSMYDFTLDASDETKSKYTVAQKSSEEIAENLGSTTQEASALLAATSGSAENNDAFNDAVGALSIAAQNGDASAVAEAKKLGATDTPVVQSQETGAHDVLFGVVSNELNGDQGAIAKGLASGDYFRKATAWIRGLFNKADHEKTSKVAGFNSDTYGVAMGIDSEVNENTRAGFGYANSQTDIETAGRDTDVDTNSLFLYAKYQPKDWYVNTILAYSWSEYDEKKSVMGIDASAKYDVDTIALQSMYGYETQFKGHDVTPEFGLRYLHINQDAYTNKLGSEVAENKEDVLTLVAAAKVAKNYTLNNGAVLRPELRAAVTYDLFDADNSANVLLANGASYRVDGEKLNRLGFELGAKVTTKATDKVEVSAGYLTRIREDYQDHTLTIDAKYNF